MFCEFFLRAVSVTLHKARWTTLLQLRTCILLFVKKTIQTRAEVFSSWYLYGIVSSAYKRLHWWLEFGTLLKISFSHSTRMTDGFSALQRLGKMERQGNVITVQFPASQWDTKQNFGKCCYLCGNGMVCGRGVSGMVRALPLSCCIHFIPPNPSSKSHFWKLFRHLVPWTS